MSDDRHKDVENKALVKTRLANFVFENGHHSTSCPRACTRPRTRGDSTSMRLGHGTIRTRP